MKQFIESIVLILVFVASSTAQNPTLGDPDRGTTKVGSKLGLTVDGIPNGSVMTKQGQKWYGGKPNMIAAFSQSRDYIRNYRSEYEKGTSTTVNFPTNDTQIDFGTDTITVDSTNTTFDFLYTGAAIVWTQGTGVVTGLSNGNTYFSIYTGRTDDFKAQIQLASTLANAISGTAIDITANTPGTYTVDYTTVDATLVYNVNTDEGQRSINFAVDGRFYAIGTWPGSGIRYLERVTEEYIPYRVVSSIEYRKLIPYNWAASPIASAAANITSGSEDVGGFAPPLSSPVSDGLIGFRISHADIPELAVVTNVDIAGNKLVLNRKATASGTGVTIGIHQPQEPGPGAAIEFSGTFNGFCLLVSTEFADVQDNPAQIRILRDGKVWSNGHVLSGSLITSPDISLQASGARASNNADIFSIGVISHSDEYSKKTSVWRIEHNTHAIIAGIYIPSYGTFSPVSTYPLGTIAVVGNSQSPGYDVDGKTYYGPAKQFVNALGYEAVVMWSGNSGMLNEGVGITMSNMTANFVSWDNGHDWLWTFGGVTDAVQGGYTEEQIRVAFSNQVEHLRSQEPRLGQMYSPEVTSRNLAGQAAGWSTGYTAISNACAQTGAIYFPNDIVSTNLIEAGIVGFGGFSVTNSIGQDHYNTISDEQHVPAMLKKLGDGLNGRTGLGE